MLKITPDTNVLISAFITKGNEYEILRLAKLGKIKLIISPEILEEFNDVIRRPKFRFSKEQIKSFNEQILSIVEIVYPKEKLDVVKDDPDDNKILEAALTGNVDYVISGDNHLLKLKKFRNVKIVNAGRFLKEDYT